MRKHAIAPIAAGMLLIAAGTASAANKTTTFTVSSTVAANCVIGAENLAFGAYTAAGVLTSSADIDVRCSNGTPYTVLLSTGAGSYAQRLLSMGTDTLQYNLFTASDLSTIWGDGVGNGTVGGVGTGLSSSEEKIHTVYGELANSAANQDAPVGSYTDSITVTIVY